MSKAGDKVTAKLAYCWDGPFCIERFVLPETVSLCDPFSKLFVRRAHVTQLKPFHGHTLYDISDELAWKQEVDSSAQELSLIHI